MSEFSQDVSLVCIRMKTLAYCEAGINVDGLAALASDTFLSIRGNIEKNVVH